MGYNGNRLVTCYGNIKWKCNYIILPGSVIIPFRDKFKIKQIMKSRPLLLHLMLKQAQTWYLLSNVREMMEIENNMPQLVEMHIEP